MEKETRKKMNTSYRKGYRFELQVKKHLEGEGWTVFRQGKSAFPDLICLQHGKIAYEKQHNPYIRFVECKVNRNQFSEEERKTFVELGDKLGVSCLLAYRKNREIKFKNIFLY